MRFFRGLLHGIFFIAVFAAAIAIIMLLWNAIIPEVIGWSAINYWQTAGLLILSRLLLGGFGNHFRHGHHHFHSFKERNNWKKQMKGMSNQERRDFIRRKMFCERDKLYRQPEDASENSNSGNE